jgi:hypothetical protein
LRRAIALFWTSIASIQGNRNTKKDKFTIFNEKLDALNPRACSKVSFLSKVEKWGNEEKLPSFINEEVLRHYRK